MDDCYFCQTIAGKTNMRHIEGIQSDQFIFVWDYNPATPGHALIIPKRHLQFMKDLLENERQNLVECAIKLKEHITSTDLPGVYESLLSGADSDTAIDFVKNSISRLQEYNRPPDGYNDGLNDGPAAGQTVPHFHWHVLPRWNGDVPETVGGIRHMFPGMGNYKKGLSQTPASS